MYSVKLKFHGRLVEVSGTELRVLSFKEINTVKDIIESINIPHTEFGDIIINGKILDNHTKIHFDCDIDVYSKPEPREFQKEPKFISDVHLGTLSRYLRFLGFDTLYRNDYSDSEIVEIAIAEKRIILTKDRGILKRRIVEYGYFVRGIEPLKQLEEVLRVYGLRGKEKVFSRCSVCNGEVESVDKKDVAEKLPTKTKEYFQEFYRCRKCGKIYWKGSHYEKLEKKIKMVLKN